MHMHDSNNAYILGGGVGVGWGVGVGGWGGVWVGGWGGVGGVGGGGGGGGYWQNPRQNTLCGIADII